MLIRETMKGGKKGWRKVVERGGKIIIPFSMGIRRKRSRNIGIILRLI